MDLFDIIYRSIPKTKKYVLAVALAHDFDVLSSVSRAVSLNLIEAILVGDEMQIRAIAATNGLSLANCRILHEPDMVLGSEVAVKLVSSGEANLLMKGLVDSSILLKAVLNKDWGLRGERIFSHVFVACIPGYNRLFLVSDAAMNIAPDLTMKKQIIENCLPIASALGIENPKVAVVCAVEKVNPKMPATLDAKELSDMQKRGEIQGCTVDGPFGFDNAVSELAAHHKGMTNPNAGKADILIMPTIEAGNILYKSITYFAKGSVACMISGARAPIVLTSRADTDNDKLNSIALACLMAGKADYKR
jgi:phosphate butyryltransferase